MAAAAAAAAPQAPASAAAPNPYKRKKPPKGKGNKNKKKKLARSDEPVRRRSNKPSAKFLKLLRKRARDYNSDDDDDERRQQKEHPPIPCRRHDDHDKEALSEDEEEEGDASSSGDESGGVTRFEQGCRAFGVAFLKIMAKKLPDDPLGPILSAHKNLVAAKLAEEVEEHKPKGEARKEKRAAAEKGHVIPKDHLDSKDKELIKVATQGVVRLFNAVSKAQKTRKDLNPSRSKDAKVLAKERKNTFLAELAITSHQDKKSQASSSFSKRTGKDEDEPGWAPLRDTYMLGSKLKDWDKIQDSAVASEQTKAALGASSDDDE
ncbi:uncharacterized protein LOC133891423 [Phragmites australis]|uniref:uncharacterized protein LOC133891423 n=1 Tax=Phragmites australis TaxID=29695 RepID=UPI002D767F55|nr:uncharacterized protein LOC133891423 [Phragmites australis]